MGTIKARYKGGYIQYYDNSTLEIVDVVAPVKLFDDFTCTAINTTNDWTFAAVNSGAIAVSAASGGVVRITTGAADDDDADLATPLIWYPSKACCMEARLTLNDVTNTAFNVGFSDATGEAADLIAFTYATATLTTTASDAALFFYDIDGTTDLLRAATVKANVDGTVIDHTAAPVAGTYNIYRVEIDSLGNVEFWLDGVLLGTQALGITTTTALCPYIGYINRETAANTMDIDYIRVWQKR